MVERGTAPASFPAPSSAPITREAIVDGISTFLSTLDAPHVEIRAAIERLIDEAGPRAMARTIRTLGVAGSHWSYYPPDPLARRIHHLLADFLLPPGSSLEGGEHLQSLPPAPLVVVCNHLSYADANLLEILLHRAGTDADAIASRLTAMAGPKVYSDPARRFSSLCFGTIKTPQSHTRSSEDAVMDAREVARMARRVIDLAHERLRKGDALLVYPEGARSRNGALQPMLPGVARYLDLPGTWVLPAGIAGTETLFPVGDTSIHPARIVVTLGRPFAAETLRAAAGGDRRLTMDAVGVLIAGLLPAAYRGAYAPAAPELDQARRVAATVLDSTP